MAIEVPKEYVLQQLKSMGIHEVTDEELNSYTKDFSHLIRARLELNSSPSTASDLSLTGNGLLQNGRHCTSQIGFTSLTSSSSSLSSADHTPFPMTTIFTPRSAVFKTFPGGKENRVQLLSPSPSSNSFLLSPDKMNVSIISVESSQGAKVKEERTRRKPVKRKVLRKCHGESRVCDESLNESAAVGLLPSTGQEQDDVGRQMSDVSLCSSVSSSKAVASESDVGLYLPPSPEHSNKRRQILSCCKSFIRPPTAPPHSRGLKKCDPVQRYHEFRQVWEAHQPPGEKNRNLLRCQIREQLLQDLPFFKAPQRVYKPNEFVVPTDKKRSSLRWHIRHTLVNQ